jgi:predicted peroxiredoxin
MENEQQNELQVMIASGPEALDRAVLGFAFALSAVTSDIKVSIILALEGTAWMDRDIPASGQSVNGFQPIRDYLDILEDYGVVVRLCSSCVENNCALADACKSVATAVSYVGMTEVAIKTANGTAQTVIF